jgi:hypothetical protein
MHTAYDARPTHPSLLVSREMQETLAIELGLVDFDLLTDRYDVLRDLPFTVETRVVPAVDDVTPCSGCTCLDGDECDAEYVITYCALDGWVRYRRAVCRGCLPIEVRSLYTAVGTDSESIRVELPLPLVNQ